MLPGIILGALCLALPAAGMPQPLTGSAVPTRPPGRNVVAQSLFPPVAKDASDLKAATLHRPKRNLDIGGVLKTIGLGVDVGGPQLNFNAPNVTLDSPIGQIGCIGGNTRRRRDDGARRSPNAESLETSQERKGQSNVSF